MQFIIVVCACLVLIAPVVPVRAQTLTNPNLSAVGDMRYNFRSPDAADGLGVNRTEFEFRELELNLEAYLNPYMRADIFIGIHGTEGPVHVEEASMTVLRGLPLSLQLKAGKYLTDFGEINQQHPHQWSWLEWPLMHRTMLGPDGLRSVGAQLSTFFAVGENAVTLSANAFSSDAFGHDHEEHAHEGPAGVEEAEEPPPDIMGSGRLSWFRQFSDAWMGEAGVSGLYGTYDSHENLKKRIAGADIKLRWRPSQYRAFVWAAELMTSDSDVARANADTTATEPVIGRVRANGVFSQFEYQFARRFDFGGFYDWSESARVEGVEAWAWGAWIGFMPVEETARVSIVYRHEEDDLYDFALDQVTIQFLFALGPHKPHTI